VLPSCRVLMMGGYNVSGYLSSATALERSIPPPVASPKLERDISEAMDGLVRREA